MSTASASALGLDTLQRGPDADSDDDDAVVGQQDVSWVEDEVVHALGRCRR